MQTVDMGEGLRREIPRVGRSLVAHLGTAPMSPGGIAHTALDNGFSCDNTKALERTGSLSPGAVASFFWRCQCRLPTPVGVVVPAPPPDAEPARVVARRVVGVEHDPVHTVKKFTVRPSFTLWWR